jgi:hypothetical protein
MRLPLQVVPPEGSSSLSTRWNNVRAELRFVNAAEWDSRKALAQARANPSGVPRCSVRVD